MTGFAFMDAQYVRIMVEAGLIGILAFLWLLRQILRTAWDTYQQVKGTRLEGLALGYIAGFMAMILHAVGANTFIVVRIMEPFWFLTGIIVVLSTLILPLGAPSNRFAPTESGPHRQLHLGALPHAPRH